MKTNKRTTVATLLATGTTLATGSSAANSSTPATGTPVEIPPSRQPFSETGPLFLCEPHRAFIEAQLRLRRNYAAIFQDLVDQFGLAGRCNSVKCFAGRMVQREPEQFDRLEFAP